MSSAADGRFVLRASIETLVHHGPGALDMLPGVLEGRRAQVVGDPEALRLHGDRLGPEWLAGAVVVPRGEAAKDWGALGRLLSELANRGLDRGSVLVGFGGGATLDTCGLAAGLLLRGVPWVACATTLVSQVDAALGGKTAVNLPAGKNLAGLFHPPCALLADSACLGTLPDPERGSGLGEVLKVALGLDPELFVHLEQEAEDYANSNRNLGALVGPCLVAKARLVEADEREQGPRAALNLGHTLGHALEHALGPGAVPHGWAVAAGLNFALELARDLGVLEEAELPGRCASLAGRLGLPRSPTELIHRVGRSVQLAELRAALTRDKKARAGRVRWVLPRGLGRLVLGVEVDEHVLASRLESVLS